MTDRARHGTPFVSVKNFPATDEDLAESDRICLKTGRKRSITACKRNPPPAGAGHTVIACFAAKYTYWMIRPAQLDDTVPTLFPNPPHPSYPAAHSCSGTSYAVAIGHFFPTHAEAARKAADAAGYSRLIAGIHYPADKRAGDTLGKAVAETVIEHAVTLAPES